MIRPGYKERAESLKKAILSLAVVAAFAMIGFGLGIVLGRYYLAPPIKSEPVPHCAYGDPAFAAALLCSFLGAMAGSVFGAYIARSLWWPTASLKLVLVLALVVLGLFAMLLG